MKEVITEKTPDGRVKKTKALRLLARRLVAAGIAGDVSALREIGDRLDGKAMQGVDLKMDITISSIERHIIDVTPVPEGKLIEVEAVELIAATPVKIPDESDR